MSDSAVAADGEEIEEAEVDSFSSPKNKIEAAMVSRRAFLKSSAASLGALTCGASPGRANDAPGVTETEIKIGQTMPYSGPLSAYGVIGKTDAAYFAMINELVH